MKIAHITVLNPVDHTRILKYVKTHLDKRHYVCVVGKTPYPINSKNAQLKYYSTGTIQRNFIQRFLTHLKIFVWWLKNYSQVDVFWIHTPELFWLFFLNKIFQKKQVYDVHENYFENTMEASYYLSFIRLPLAFFVRWMEKIIAKLAFVVYAEYCYENILNAKKYEIIPNTFDEDLLKDISIQHPQELHLVLSGNLSEDWGVIEAIDFWEKQNEFQSCYLTIIGYSSLPNFSKIIRQRIQNSRYSERCKLIGIEKYVPYREILRAIASCSYVLAPYRNKKKFQFKIPTKFYEAMAMQKPVLFSNIPYWNELNQKYQFGFCIKDWESLLMNKVPLGDVPKSFYSWKSQIHKIEKILTS